MSDFPARISAKFFLRDGGDVDAPALIPVFHEWIRRGGVVSGLVIDVADYHHVPDGPGVMLIGHEWDRAVDFTGGRAGVLSVSKRDLDGSLSERVAAVVADALAAASALAGEPSVPWARVGLDEVEVTILDRLFAPNTPESLEAIGPEIAAALAPLNDGAGPGLEQVGDTRRPFKVRASLAGAPDLAAALEGLRASAVA
ncbi:MAG: hypothetical protein KDC33_00910 [Thermoleophilia bacterium]|nr:hypothetical protein [Thermoleophilia bacterium]